MDFLGDITHLIISLIFSFLFWTFVSVEQKLLHQFKGVRGFHTLLAENPMLRYKTSNGPITTPLGLLSLSTMSSSMYYQHSANAPNNFSTRSYHSGQSSYLSRSTYSHSLYADEEEMKKEILKEREKDLREEEEHTMMQLVIQSLVTEPDLKAQKTNSGPKNIQLANSVKVVPNSEKTADFEHIGQAASFKPDFNENKLQIDIGGIQS